MNVKAQALNLLAIHQDEILLEGQPAPWTGVLLWPEIYRENQKTIEKYNLRVSKDVDKGYESSATDGLNFSLFSGQTFLGVVIGISIGLVLGVVVIHR